jgi:hypothetical protein
VTELSEAPKVSEQREQQETEPYAGYYVASQNRPAFVTDLTSDEIRQVFDLVQRVANLPRKRTGNPAQATEAEGAES